MKKILVVVDVQNGFCKFDKSDTFKDKILSLVSSGYFDYTIATRFLNHEGSQYTRMLKWHHLQTSPEIDLIPNLTVDEVIDKNIYTCVSTSFLELLREVNDGTLPTHIFVCGVDTDCCVLKTSADLFEQSIMPLVLTDYCSSNGGELSHDAALTVMRRTIGKQSLIHGNINSREELEEIISKRNY